MPGFTIYCEVNRFDIIGTRDDEDNAKSFACNRSLADMQSLIYIQNEEKEVIAVCFRGQLFERRVENKE